MKLNFKVSLELDDEFKEIWTKNQINYYSSMYGGDQEKIAQVLEENPFEKDIAAGLADLIDNEPYVLDCAVTSNKF